MRARAPRSGERPALTTSPDRFRFTTLAHAGRDVLGPVRVASVDAMLAHLVDGGARGGVLDVGCGKGEILVRALERLAGTGVGIEPNPAFASEARARIDARLGGDRAVVHLATYADAPLSAARFGVVICTGSLHAFGDWQATLAAQARLVEPGGWALLAPGYWRRPPHPDYLASFGGAASEQCSLPDTLALAERAGWRVIAHHASTLDEWDEYEHAYAGNVRQWCDTNPADPDAASFRERIERWASAYARWGRDTMGYALLLLQRG